jgi:hypothetical protein
VWIGDGVTSEDWEWLIGTSRLMLRYGREIVRDSYTVTFLGDEVTSFHRMV